MFFAIESFLNILNVFVFEMQECIVINELICKTFIAFSYLYLLVNYCSYYFLRNPEVNVKNVTVSLFVKHLQYN